MYFDSRAYQARKQPSYREHGTSPTSAASAGNGQMDGQATSPDTELDRFLLERERAGDKSFAMLSERQSFEPDPEVASHLSTGSLDPAVTGSAAEVRQQSGRSDQEGRSAGIDLESCFADCWRRIISACEWVLGVSAGEVDFVPNTGGNSASEPGWESYTTTTSTVGRQNVATLGVMRSPGDELALVEPGLGRDAAGDIGLVTTNTGLGRDTAGDIELATANSGLGRGVAGDIELSATNTEFGRGFTSLAGTWSDSKSGLERGVAADAGLGRALTHVPGGDPRLASDFGLARALTSVAGSELLLSDPKTDAEVDRSPVVVAAVEVVSANTAIAGMTGRSLSMLGSLFNKLPLQPFRNVVLDDSGQLGDKQAQHQDGQMQQHAHVTKQPHSTSTFPRAPAEHAAAYEGKENIHGLDDNKFPEAHLSELYGEPPFHDVIGHTNHAETPFHDVIGHTKHAETPFHDVIGHTKHAETPFHDVIGHTKHAETPFHDVIGHTKHAETPFHDVIGHTKHAETPFHEVIGRTKQTELPFHGAIGHIKHQVNGAELSFQDVVGLPHFNPTGSEVEVFNTEQGMTASTTIEMDNLRFALDHTDADGGFVAIPTWTPRRLNGRKLPGLLFPILACRRGIVGWSNRPRS